VQAENVSFLQWHKQSMFYIRGAKLHIIVGQCK